MSLNFSVFSHLVSPKADDYREVLRVFSEARSEFVIHLRPAEIAGELHVPVAEIEILLDQLAEWGNLDRSRDHVDAVSVEEFYRVKWLYQLSARGEAAERALEAYEEALHQPGELQTEALRDIIDYLEALRRLLESEGSPERADYGKLLRQFNHLNDCFEEFTVQAQRFMQFLQGTIELHGLSLEDFIDYKDRLIDYLQRFVGELITSTNEIEERITALERLDVRGYFAGISLQARADAIDPENLDEQQREQQRREGRWDGLRRWFLGDTETGSQAETLRARAREAIPALLVALQNFHDQRETGSDRRRDWFQLATWFAEMPSDEMAHRLWRVAFAMAPARHLRINEETLGIRDQSSETTRTSWLEAEPMWLEPQLRKTGRTQRTGGQRPIVDLSKEREALRRLAEEENAQIAKAHGRLLMAESAYLSEFGTLESAAFDLLLDLLGRAMVEAVGRAANDFPVVVNSTDGSLAISLWQTEGRLPARVVTTDGVLEGPDFQVRIVAAEGGAHLASAS